MEITCSLPVVRKNNNSGFIKNSEKKSDKDEGRFTNEQIDKLNVVKENIFNQQEINENFTFNPEVDINYYIRFDEDKIEKSFSLIDDDYISSEIIDYGSIIHREEFEKLKMKLFDNKDLNDLRKQIERTNLDFNGNLKNNNIGPISSLDYLVETSFKSDEKRRKSIIDHFISLEDFVFRWREIGGDGNCYYRAVIFAYLENVIFQENIFMLQYFILDLHNKFYNEDVLMKKLDSDGIKRDLVVKILILIHSILNEKELQSKGENVIKAYDIYLRCFNNCKAFDLGLIFYFRFKLYEFIKANEDKLYSKDFSVKLGNLLPNEYETEKGEFLYDKFYENYLLRLSKDAEKIVIYITPFVLKINLQILIYDFGRCNIEKLKSFPFLKKGVVNIQTLTLLYKRTHYDLIYDVKYFEKYTKYLTLYVNLAENLKIFNWKLIEEISKKKKEYYDLGLNQEKNTDLLIFEKSDEVNNKNIQEKEFLVKEEKLKVKEEEDQNQIQVKFVDYEIRPVIKCQKCKCEYIPYQNKINFCRDCISNEVKTVILSKYFYFLQSCKINFLDKKESSSSKIIFNQIFYDENFKLLQDKFTIAQSLCLIDSNIPDFISKEIKSTLCAICENSIDTKQSILSYFLPCQCLLCSPKCLKAYFGILFSSTGAQLSCICSTELTTNELKKLIFFCHSNNVKKAKEHLINIFRGKIATQCMICLTTKIEQNSGLIMEMKDTEVEQITNIKTFHHKICDTCTEDNFLKGESFNPTNQIELNNLQSSIKNKPQYCMICNSVHLLTCLKYSKGENKLICNKECQIL